MTSSNSDIFRVKVPESTGGFPSQRDNKQRVLTPGHQGWNDLHSLCPIGMEYYLLNNDDEEDEEEEEEDDDEDNRNNNNNDNDYNHNNDTNNDNDENDNDKNSSDSIPVTV